VIRQTNTAETGALYAQTKIVAQAFRAFP